MDIVHARKRLGQSGRLLVAFAAALVLLAGLVASASAGQPGAVMSTSSQDTSRGPVSSNAMTATVHLPRIGRSFYPGPSIFGAQMYYALDREAAGLDYTRDARVSWVRWPVYWVSLEPTATTPPTYRWANLDRSVLAARQAGLNMIVTIDGNPKWAAQYSSGPISETIGLDHFVQLMRALAERYDGDGIEDAPGSPIVDDWEFYNEPDAGDATRAAMGWGSYWGHFGSAYAEMLCAVRPGMKEANPRARVLMGGMAYDWFEEDGGPFVRSFLDDILANGGGECMDAMNFHAYPAFADNWKAYGPGLLGKTNYLRQKLTEYGVGHLPIVVTESGWHSDSPPDQSYASTPENQARFVPKLFSEAIAAGLRTMIWFSWLDAGGSWPDNGLFWDGLQPKPSYFAYKAASARLQAVRFQRALTRDELGEPSLEGYVFGDGQPLYVLWSNLTPVSQTVGITHTVALPAAHVRLADMYGNDMGDVRDADDGQADGRVRVPAGPNPVYIQAVE